RKVLGETLQVVLDKKEPDSPVYTYLDGLTPPLLEEQVQAIESHADDMEDTEDDGEVKVLKRKPGIKQDKTLALLIEQGEVAIDKKEFSKARKLFESALLIGADTMEGQ